MTKRNSGSELQVSARPSPDQVRGQVDKILASRWFARSERLCRFLRFCVELTLHEKSDQLKEQLVGVEVFDRKGDYDPRTDPIVRVEARRLRSKLKEYYTSSGRPDCLLIELPKGAYVPSFRMARTRASRAPQPVASAAERTLHRRASVHQPDSGGRHRLLQRRSYRRADSSAHAHPTAASGGLEFHVAIARPGARSGGHPPRVESGYRTARAAFAGRTRECE